MDKYLYLIINFASISIPFLASFYPKHPFYKQWKNYFIANIFVAAFFIVWDVFFTKIGIWGFNYRYLIGINFFTIPIEEVMFFFFIPYSSVFVYFSLNYLIKKNPIDKFQKYITLFLAICLAIIGVFYWNHLYTSVTFILTSIYLLYNYFKNQNLSKIYFSYFFTLFFFFIVNGILTGSCIEEPVVWYDDNQNLGIRLGTIPVEDVFYGFLLIASIIQLFEVLNARKNTKMDC